MTAHHDDDLRGRFQALAAEDAGLTPDFERTLEAPARRRPLPLAHLAVAAAAVLAIAGAAAYRWVAGRPGALPYPIDLAAVTWEAPTDFLLATPGAELLRDLPSFGAGYDDFTAGSPDTDDTLRRNPS